MVLSVLLTILSAIWIGLSVMLIAMGWYGAYCYILLAAVLITELFIVIQMFKRLGVKKGILYSILSAMVWLYTLALMTTTHESSFEILMIVNSVWVGYTCIRHWITPKAAK